MRKRVRNTFTILECREGKSLVCTNNRGGKEGGRGGEDFDRRKKKQPSLDLHIVITAVRPL